MRLSARMGRCSCGFAGVRVSVCVLAEAEITGGEMCIALKLSPSFNQNLCFSLRHNSPSQCQINILPALLSTPLGTALAL